MKYVHIRNLEKYQDGYKDRRHYWAKIHLDIVQGNVDSELLSEIDFARFVKFIVLESCTQRPIPASEAYLIRKGFDFSAKSLEATLQDLSHFIEIIEYEPIKDNQSYVYFVFDASKGAIKIGFTSKLEVRMNRHKYLIGEENFEFLCAIRGDRETERTYHEKFKAKKFVGEWFFDCQEIRGEIEILISKGIAISNVTESCNFCNENSQIPSPREEKKREEKKREDIYPENHSNELPNSEKARNSQEAKRHEIAEREKWFDEIWEKYPVKDGKKHAKRHFMATVKDASDYARISKALEIYLDTKRVKEGFVKNGSTWFNGWEDWLGYADPVKPETDQEKADRIIAEMKRGAYAKSV